MQIEKMKAAVGVVHAFLKTRVIFRLRTLSEKRPIRVKAFQGFLVGVHAAIAQKVPLFPDSDIKLACFACHIISLHRLTPCK